MNKLKIFSFIVIATLITNNLYSQINPLGQENSFMALDRQTGFIIMSGSALGSYLISKFLIDDPKLNFYQGHIGYYTGSSGGHMAQDGESDNYSVIMENFGVEREFSRWFSMRIEANIQEITGNDYFNVGGGIKTYYKWTILRKKRIHPFIEYGAGIFCAFNEFPEDGTKCTFNLNYAVGAEYILSNNDKIMLDLNFKHHSNNGMGDRNPGFDGNGISISYCWSWKKNGD